MLLELIVCKVDYKQFLPKFWKNMEELRLTCNFLHQFCHSFVNTGVPLANFSSSEKNSLCMDK